MELNKSFVGQKLAQVAKFAELEEEDLTAKQLLDVWQYEKLNQNPENFSKVAAVAEALLDLKGNFNKRLVLQSLFLKNIVHRYADYTDGTDSKQQVY